jgi:hypothetical protein
VGWESINKVERSVAHRDAAVRAAYIKAYRMKNLVRLQAAERVRRRENPEKYRAMEKRRLRKHYAQICARRLARHQAFGDLRAERLEEMARLEVSCGDMSMWERFALTFSASARDHFWDERSGDAADQWLASAAARQQPSREIPMTDKAYVLRSAASKAVDRRYAPWRRV